MRSRLAPKPHEATRRACVLARWSARDHPCPALCIAHAPEKSRSITLLVTAPREDTRISESQRRLAIRLMKTCVTPISQTKTQALARALASVTHGYTRVCTGTVPPARLSALASKFDALYGIAHTKGQRVVNKRAGRANTLFAAYAPPDEYRVENERLPWMLLATPGDGVETECWQNVLDRPVWLDYQLCRHNDAGELRWTWRRTSAELTQLYAELDEDLARHRHT